MGKNKFTDNTRASWTKYSKQVLPLELNTEEKDHTESPNIDNTKAILDQRLDDIIHQNYTNANIKTLPSDNWTTYENAFIAMQSGSLHEHANYGIAYDNYTAASNKFRIEKLWKLAAIAYLKAGDMSLKLNNVYNAYYAYISAIEMYNTESKAITLTSNNNEYNERHARIAPYITMVTNLCANSKDQNLCTEFASFLSDYAATLAKNHLYHHAIKYYEECTSHYISTKMYDDAYTTMLHTNTIHEILYHTGIVAKNTEKLAVVAAHTKKPATVINNHIFVSIISHLATATQQLPASVQICLSKIKEYHKLFPSFTPSCIQCTTLLQITDHITTKQKSTIAITIPLLQCHDAHYIDRTLETLSCIHNPK